jgi:hypothetical protein
MDVVLHPRDLDNIMTVHVTAPMIAAFNHFMSVGFIENGAGAAVGNFCQESGEFLIATMFRAHPDASGGVPDALKSGGIAEWLGDRKTAYIAFSGRAETRLGLAKGSLLNDLGTQCDFVVYELQTTPEYETLYKQLTGGSRSIANLTANFMMVYERPKLGPTANLDNRIAHAEAVVAKARLLKAPPAPQPASPPPTPAPSPSQPAPPAGPPTISATIAGLDAAILDHFGAIRDALVAQRDAINIRIAKIEAQATDFAKLEEIFTPPPPPPPVLQIKAVEPAVPSKGKTSMNGSAKPAIASTGVWGGIIATAGPMLVTALNYFGTNGGLSPQASTVVMGISGVLGGLLAMYGRITATQPITGVLKS